MYTKDNNNTGKPFYHPYAAQEIALKHEKELGVKIMPFQMMVYVPSKQEYYPIDEVSRYGLFPLLLSHARNLFGIIHPCSHPPTHHHHSTPIYRYPKERRQQTYQALNCDNYYVMVMISLSGSRTLLYVGGGVSFYITRSTTQTHYS